MLMIRNIITEQPIKIATSNTKRIIGIQFLVFFLSKKYDIKKLLFRITEWGGASLLLQLWARNYLKSLEVRHTMMPVARAGIVSSLFSKNIQIWIICDAIAKNMFHYLRLFNIPAPNVILCSLAGSEIITNWVLYEERLLPSYRTFLDYQGMSDYSGVKNSTVLHDYFYQKNNTYKSPDEVIRKLMPNGGIRWCMYHFVIKSLPFYFTLHSLQAMLSMEIKLRPFINNLVSSSSFLTAFCYTAYGQGRYTLDSTELGFRTGLLIPGLMLVLERNAIARRSISHYCMCMALYSYIKDEKILGVYNYLLGNLTDYNQLRTLINMV